MAGGAKKMRLITYMASIPGPRRPAAKKIAGNIPRYAGNGSGVRFGPGFSAVFAQLALPKS